MGQMWKTLILAALIAGCVCQQDKLSFITGDVGFSPTVPVPPAVGALLPTHTGIDLEDIYRLDSTGTRISLRNGIDAASFSERVMWFFYQPNIAGTPGFTASTNELQFDQHNRLLVTAPFGVDLRTYDFKLEAPFLEIDPAECPGINALDCRCNAQLLPASRGTRPYIADDTEKILVEPPQVGAPPNSLIVTIPGNTYFEHAPFAGQDPFLRTFRRLCYRTTAAGAWRDSGVYIAVTQACGVGVNGAIAGIDPVLADCRLKDADGLRVTSLAGGVRAVDPTDDAGEPAGALGEFYTTTDTLVRPATVAENVFEGETSAMRAERLTRTVCCGASGALGVITVNGRTFAVDDTNVRLGVCIPPNSADAQCCGRRPFNPRSERCCNRITSDLALLEQPCPCASGATLDDVDVDLTCSRQASNVINTAGDFAGIRQATATTSRCCNINQSRFPGFPAQVVEQHSFCTGNGFDCCDDGNVFDPGSQQCCNINGVQSLDAPCPCSVDSHCGGGQRCCFQIWPLLVEDAGRCSAFANFPLVLNAAGDAFQLSRGPALAQVQQCRGTCYDTRYQICCNGRLCERNFERCCNDTCCNGFTQTCTEGRRPGSLATRGNPRDFGVFFEVCTAVEHLTGFRAFFVFIIPITMLFATLFSLALVAVLARRATEHIFELTERAIVFFAVAAVFICCPFYFSPLYKWALVIALVSLAAIVIAVARKRAASLLLIILLVVLVLYVINPFAGNTYLGFYDAVPVDNARIDSSLFEAAQYLWRNNFQCVSFYQYFVYDPAVRDFSRWDNPEVRTFGYCSRAYSTTLLILTCILYVIVLTLLLLAIFSYVKKLGYKPVEPIELEVTYDVPAAPFAAPLY